MYHNGQAVDSITPQVMQFTSSHHIIIYLAAVCAERCHVEEDGEGDMSVVLLQPSSVLNEAFEVQSEHQREILNQKLLCSFTEHES